MVGGQPQLAIYVGVATGDLLELVVEHGDDGTLEGRVVSVCKPVSDQHLLILLSMRKVLDD